MHVAILSPYDPRPTALRDPQGTVGGVENALRGLAAGLRAAGARVTVVASGNPARKGREGDDVEYAIHPRAGTLFRVPLARLDRHLPTDADVIHVPATYPLHTDLAILRARRHGIPVILDFHFDPVPTSWAMHAAAFAYRATLARALRLADGLIVHSRAYAQRFSLTAAYAADRVAEIPNGIDAARFCPPTRPTRGTHVLFVGRLIPYKGVDVLLEAAARWQRRLDAPLVIAGDGPLRTPLEAQARALGVDARFTGFVPDADLPAAYQSARLTVLPSVNGQEAFGIALAESIACGTPVIASDLPGVRDVARLGGRVTPPGDADALSRAVVESLKDPAPDAQQLHARAAHAFDWPVVARRTLAFYRHVKQEVHA